MDFGIIYQLKVKKYWWLDTILYFVIALLLASFFSFFIFTFKISIENKKLVELDQQLANVGTAQQKEMEKQVFDYQKKIDNFASILNAHKIPTNVLDDLKASTLQNVWFNHFAMDAKTALISVNGETDDVTSISQQINILESKKFVKNITNLSLELKQAARVSFTFDLMLDPEIFFTALDSIPMTELPPVGGTGTTSPSSSLIFKNPIF